MITSRLIGKIGGSEVTKTPVSVVASGSSGSIETMMTVHVPEDQTWLIVVFGDLDPSSGTGRAPRLEIADHTSEYLERSGAVSHVAEASGSVTVSVRRGRDSGADAFVGDVYTVPMPD